MSLSQYVRLLVTGSCFLIGVPASQATLALSTDHRPIVFGLMQLDEEKTVSEAGNYQNELTCSSTNHRSWYLKIHLLQPFSSGSAVIPPEQLSWQATVVGGGQGALVLPNEFTPFRLMPDLVYSSGAGENGGDQVKIQFRYRLRLPSQQRSGAYHTMIRFTLMEYL